VGGARFVWEKVFNDLLPEAYTPWDCPELKKVADDLGMQGVFLVFFSRIGSTTGGWIFLEEMGVDVPAHKWRHLGWWIWG